jgi:anionic cell wall polymer biosynthesis LytR-Cps2A-Psr (LCP) family protein
VKKIVDLIGGIDIELTKAEADSLTWNWGNPVKQFHEGINRLDGRWALSYARLRKIDSDWQRVGRQRKVILAVVDEMKNSSLLELNELANEVLPMIQTNMTKMDITELVLYAPKFLTSEFDQMTIPKTGTYGGIPIRGNQYGFGVDYEINNDLLYRFLYEGTSSEELLAE